MSKALLSPLVASLAILGISLASASGSPGVPRVECGRPGALRLNRFEDGSARLLCGDRVLVRVSVPH